MNLTRFLHRPVSSLCGRVHSKSLYMSPCRLASASSLAEIRSRPTEKPAKAVPRRPKRLPFVARFFRADIDEVLFEYPELTGQQLSHMKELASTVENFFKTNVNIPQMQTLNRIPDDVLKGLKSLGLFSLLVPKLYGGLELGAVEMNYLGEVISQYPAIFHMINFHNIYGVNIVLKGGTESQKQTLLPKLSSGDLLFGVCIWEKNTGSDLLSIQTKAAPLDKQTFLLTGKKIWANYIDNADKLLVLANIAVSPDADPDLTFFLVDKNTAGITVKSVEKSCIQQMGTFEVSFDNVIVNTDNILGSTGKGFELANLPVLNDRTIMPSAVIQTVRLLFDKVAQHVIHREQFGQTLFNFDTIKWKLAQASTKLYVLESMVYMTAGIHDTYEDQNIQIESAITKVFAMETLQFCLNIFSDLFGSRIMEKDLGLPSILEDAQFLNICEGSKDVIKMHITLNCLRLLGESEYERVKKLRNPLFFPKEHFKDLLFSLNQSKDQPRITKIVSNNLHPSLMEPADTLEYCINRLRWAADLNIVFHTLKLSDQQNIMTGLADIVIECYAMTAALARASRSYCIGLKNAETELMTVHIYVSQQVAKIRQLVECLDPYNPPLSTSTIHHIADTIGKCKRYFAEHPTARNFD